MSRKDWAQKGKTRALPDFAPMLRYVHDSAAWKALKPTEMATFVEVTMRYFGHNNGRITISTREVGDALGVSKMTAARSLRRLCEVGLLVLETPASFGTNGRKAPEYRLTMFRSNIEGQSPAPSKDFLKWRPEKQNVVTSQALASNTTGTQRPESAKGDGLRNTTGTQRGAKAPSPVTSEVHIYNSTTGVAATAGGKP